MRELYAPAGTRTQCRPLAKRTKTVYKYRYGGPMTEELTPKQQKILNFVRKAIEKTGFPPTRIEISKAFRYSSPNAAEEHLRMLERKGAIELTPGASRGIGLTEGLGLPHPRVGACRAALSSRSRLVPAAR